MKRMMTALVLLGAGTCLHCASAAESAGKTNAAAAARPAAAPEALFTDSVVAKGKGFEIKRSELDAEIVNTRAMYAARGMPAPMDADKQVLHGLIIKHLILGKATAAEKAKGKEQFESFLERMKTNSHLTDEQFNQRLSQQLVVQGITRSQWEKQNIEQATLPIVVERDLKISVTDEEVKKFYDDFPARFEQAEMVRASHILLMTQDPATGQPLADDKKQAKQKQMEDLLKRARAGEDFSKMAMEYSEDTGSKERGGEYTFARASADPSRAMVPEFEAAAFSLKTNEVSDVVTTQYGYHIIKLSEKIPAKKLEFAVVKDDIKQGLKQQAMQKQFLDYSQKLEKDGGVEILDEKLKLEEKPAFMEPATNPPAVKPPAK